jgi:hypothetical protein
VLEVVEKQERTALVVAVRVLLVGVQGTLVLHVLSALHLLRHVRASDELGTENVAAALAVSKAQMYT